jgi:PKD repeat protein
VAFVNQIPDPIADFSFSIFNTNTVNFSILNPLPGQTYRWNFGNGNISTVTGTAASQTYTSNGVYQVRLVVQNACGTDTIVRTVSITGVGMADQFSSGCKVYPQPVAGHLYVEHAQGSTPLTAWQLKDICGNVLQEEAVNSSDRLVVPMESYAPGVYLLMLISGPSILTKKIIKQ